MLFLYAIAFSCAYATLGAGIGALILFGAVQVTMIVAGFYNGERPSAVEGIGLVIASLGLVYLVSPGLSAQEPAGAAMMTVVGVAWGGNALRGRVSGDPVRATASNFLCVTPFAVCALHALVRPGDVVDLLLRVATGVPLTGMPNCFAARRAAVSSVNSRSAPCSVATCKACVSPTCSGKSLDKATNAGLQDPFGVTRLTFRPGVRNSEGRCRSTSNHTVAGTSSSL